MQHESRNISMLMDFYEMTMAHGYFTKLENMDRVAFDVFFRRNPDKGGFAIFGGLEQIVEYILNLHFDESDISYLRDQGIFSEEFLAYLKKEESASNQVLAEIEEVVERAHSQFKNE
ncbi:MAG: hypothetical protein KHX71_06930 [Streptococcus mitis]|nr:hypothetical protein [Streptococcus mitis]